MHANLLARLSLLLFLPVFCTVQAQVEEVVVTAQKRTEDVQDVPISISTFSGDFLEDSGIDTLQQMGNYTPNLSLTQSSQVANQRIIMRGVGSVGNSGIEPSVAVFIDGVYYPRPSSVVGTLTDLELVEVLRGPQGTLFGRNASMGALNIRTAKPADEFEASLRASYGDYDALRVSGSLSGGFSETASGRLSFQHSSRDGYGDNTFVTGGSRSEVGAWEDGSVRGKLYVTPIEALEVTLTLDYARVENEGPVMEVLSSSVVSPLYQTILGAALDPNATPGLIPPGFLGPGPLPELNNGFDYTINQDHQDTADDEQHGVAADISLHIGEHTVRSITAYRNWTNDTFESVLRLPANLINRVTAYEADTISQELQLISPTGGFFEYVAGLYYYEEDFTIDQDFDLGPDFCQVAANAAFLRTFSVTGSAPAGLMASGQTSLACNFLGPLDNAVDGFFEQDVSSFAVYGQLTMNVTDQLRLTGGFRFTSDEKEGRFSQQVNNPALSPAILDLRVDEGPLLLDFEDDEVTWLANLSYFLNEDVMAFATYSTGFKSGGFNTDGFNSIGLARMIPRVFESETVDNYEFGVKSSWVDNRIVANLTYFNTSIDDFQDRQFDGVNFLVQNVGELTQQGIELDVRANPVDPLTLVLGLSYLDSEFDSFPDATALPFDVAAAQATTAASRILAPPGVIVTPTPQDLTGESNHFSPEWQLSLVGEWASPLPNTALEWFVRGEFQYIDDQNVGAETNQNPQSVQEGYELFNARFGLRGDAPEVSWELSMFVQNAGDEEYCQTVINQPVGTTLGLVDPVTRGGLQRCVLGAPRTYGVEAALRF